MIEIKNLYFTYSKRNKLFENLNLTLSESHIYGLLGKNGTGKTTLLSLVSGLLFPVKGKIDVMGKNPEKRKWICCRNCFLFRKNLIFPMSAQ